MLIISSKNLLANYSFKEHCILSLIPWLALKFPISQKIEVYSECGLWADQRLALCKRAASSSKPPSSLTSHPDTWMGYNKLQLKFLCCWSWPLSCSPNEVFWCAPKIHGLLFSIPFAVPALTSGLAKNVSFHTMPPLGANCSFLPQLPLSHAVLKHHRSRSSLSVGN